MHNKNIKNDMKVSESRDSKWNKRKNSTFQERADKVTKNPKYKYILIDIKCM